MTDGPLDGECDDPFRFSIAEYADPANAGRAQTLLTKLANGYELVGRNHELVFGCLRQDARGNEEGMEDEINQIDEQIGLLKLQMKKLDKILEMISRLMPMFLSMIGQDDELNPLRGSNSGALEASKESFSTLLMTELERISGEMDPATIRQITDGITKGGAGAMAISLFIVTLIAEAVADQSISPTGANTNDFEAGSFQAHLDEIGKKAAIYAATPKSLTEGFWFFASEVANPDFTIAQTDLIQTVFPGLQDGLDVPLTKNFADSATHGVEVEGLKITAEMMATATALLALPFSQHEQAGATFLFNRVSDQVVQKMTTLGDQIDELLDQKKMLSEQIQERDTEVFRLEQASQKAFVDLRTQKVKAITGVKKLSDNPDINAAEIKTLVDLLVSALKTSSQPVADAILPKCAGTRRSTSTRRALLLRTDPPATETV